MVYRVYVEKKPGFDVEAKSLLEELKENLGLSRLEGLRLFNRYDIEGVDRSTYESAKYTVFAEAPADTAYDESIRLEEDALYFAVEYLPGQYDQRADSAAQCIKLINIGAQPTVRYAKVIALYGDLSPEDLQAVKAYYINPVDSQEASLEKPQTLNMDMPKPEKVARIEGFIAMSPQQIESLRTENGFAMSRQDLLFVQRYFADEQRDPTITELKVIDTYWSDHCRHTTFLTEITQVDFEDSAYGHLLKNAYEDYLSMRREVYGEKDRPISLMDLAVIGTKYLKRQGLCDDLDESEEVNACSIRVKADMNGKEENWLVMFKNETHNHPTEIEPFGGAATCLGGAIRDPLSGRAYVYQAMRITGSGDPRSGIKDTLPGKLPQRKITKEAAKGYSSYGNQIGLSTGLVDEIYHPGYVAKRMEVGAVIAAAPEENVLRKRPAAGDAVILVGGRTGRDGCGGATGSSKEHTQDSILTCGAEVQKGNPPVERNLQRLFRQKDAAQMIKRCNDFGAGGVSVAIGELADSLDVDLDLVLKKYEGLDGTELAISESQERMAVVVSHEDKDRFIRLAREENLEAVAVAKVTDSGRFRMFWQGDLILDLSREFLNTNGVRQQTTAFATALTEKSPDRLFASREPLPANPDQKTLLSRLKKEAASLNCCSKKGLIEMFDSTIGAATVLMPLGGKHQLTPALGMAAKLPLTQGDTQTATLMTYGFDPELSSESPYHGALYAVIDSAAKIAGMGGDPSRARLSFQEYFEHLGSDPKRWGKPLSALLGALRAQKELGIPSIGGKDSMSGTFMDLHVPPTLISFAVGTASAGSILSPEIKGPGHQLALVYAERDSQGIIDFAQFNANMRSVSQAISQGRILSASTVGFGGLFMSLLKMCAGNGFGARITWPAETLLDKNYGALVVELAEGKAPEEALEGACFRLIGASLEQAELVINGSALSLDQLLESWQSTLEPVFPSAAAVDKTRPVSQSLYTHKSTAKPAVLTARPRVFIPAFPGTNCEMDSKRAFEKAGAQAHIHILKNLTPAELEQSISQMAKQIRQSQIIMIPGGFSGGDEPDGSAKFITAVFRNPYICEAVTDLLENRDGLMLGICNGFQALIKLGLLPFGWIGEIQTDSPTLTYNAIGRHVSRLVTTRVTSVKSPWLSLCSPGQLHTLAVSHGEGRFVASGETLQALMENGQIATQYVDPQGKATMDPLYNPNDSLWAIEGITSPDGRILGKMGHSERIGENVYRNVPGDKDQKLFEAGVRYFL